MKKKTVDTWKPNLVGGAIFLGLVSVGVLSGGIGLLFLPAIGLPTALAYVNEKKNKSQEFDMGEFLLILLLAGPVMSIMAGLFIIPFVLPVVVVVHLVTGKPFIDPESGPSDPGESARLARQAEYHDYLQSEDWQRKRYVVLKRDNGKCVHCGAPATQVHHKKYARHSIGREPIEWLESVCDSCHQELHSN